MTVEIDHRRSSKTPQLLCECDGIGRRMGLKIPGSNTVMVRSPPEGTLRKCRTLRASDSEWEIIKDFARVLKHDPERAARMMKTE